VRVKGYSKEEINRLFERFVKTKDDKTFELLMAACEPVMEIVLTKYLKYIRHHEDIKQSVRLKLWKNVRMSKGLSEYLINPSAYLFFIIRWYVRVAFERIKSIYKEEFEVTLSGSVRREILSMQNEYLDPELLYLFKKELPRELYESCKKRILKSGVLAEDFKKVEKAIMQVKEMIEDDFGVILK